MKKYLTWDDVAWRIAIQLKKEKQILSAANLFSNLLLSAGIINNKRIDPYLLTLLYNSANRIAKECYKLKYNF